MKREILFLLIALAFAGCLEHEPGLEDWSPAGSTLTPNEGLEIFVTPTPSPTVAATASATATPTAQATKQATATPTKQPSPSPSPQAENTCTVTVAPGSNNLHKQVVVKFTEDTSAAVYCSGTASAQYVSLTLSGSGLYTGFADCYYSNPGAYLISAEGSDDTECSKQITVESE